MTIRIERNTAGNCLLFHGQTNPVYFNACLSAEIIDTDYVNIINDIASNENETRYEYYRLHFSEFADADNNVFTSAQEVVDYLAEVGNVTTSVGTAAVFGPEESLDFEHDATQTSILFSNGDHHGVNSIKAVALENGLISIQAMLSDHEFYQLPHTNVTILKNAVPGGLQDVVNALNEYFTVGAFESVVIQDPYSTLVADVAGVTATMNILGTHGVDPVGDDVFGATSTGSLNGYKSTETIDQAGEYFTFDIRNEAQLGFGLVMSDTTFSNGTYPAGTNATYADPATFAVGNNAHYGFQFSHWFHPTPNGPWTNYGAKTSYVQGPGWTHSTLKFSASPEGADWLAGNPVKIKVGIDANSFIEIAYYDVSESAWVVCARTGYPVIEGSAYHLGIKMGNTVGRVYTTPKVHLLEPAAPVLNFRYIESPDGYYSFPLFATQEEADYYELTEAGADNGSHTHVYVDDPTMATWYMPNTQFQMNYGLTPVEDGLTTFQSNPIVWTEITSLTDADLVPAAFSGGDQTVSENQALNLQIEPQDVGYTTTVSGLPSELSFDGGTLITGTTPYVPEDTTYTITVTRTNSYGNSVGTFDLTIQDNASIGDLTGFTETDGNFVQPNRVVLTHDALFQYDTVLSQDQQLTYSYSDGSNPPTIGILSSQGETDLAAFDPAVDTLGSGSYNFAETEKWDLRYVSFGGYIGGSGTKHALVGWQDNTTQTGSEGTNTDVEFKLSYEVDTVHGSNYHIVLYRNDVEILRSADHYSGDQTITLAAFDDQQQTDVYVPSNWTITNVGAGSTQPPTGFTDPLLQGTMDSTTVLSSDSAAQLSDTLEVGMRYVFPRAWVEQNILPHFADLNTEAFVGVPAASADWADVGASDFDAFFRIKGNGDNTHVSNIKTTSNAYDTMTVNSMTNAFYDYALEWDGDDLHVIACNINDINLQPGVSNGGSFGRVLTESAYSGSGALSLVIATDNGGKVTLTTSNLQKIRIPFGTHDVLVGESSSGNGQFALQPVASSFDDPYQHASSNLSYAGISSLNAGETYRFVYDPSLEANDYIEFRLASDGTTVYNTGVTTFDGTSDGDPKAGEKFKGVTFAVPADAPPLVLYYYNGFSGSFDAGRPISIAGSTFVTPVTGITMEGPVANQTGAVMDDTSWISVDESLGSGERLVIPGSVISEIALELGDGETAMLGLKDSAWANTITDSTGFEGPVYMTIARTDASNVSVSISSDVGGTAVSTLTETAANTANFYAFMEITNSGNNIRMALGSDGGNTSSTTLYSDWDEGKVQSGDQGYGITSLDVAMLYIRSGDFFNTADVTWSNLTETSVPAVSTNDTSWTKALDFSGSNERTEMVSSSSAHNPMMMGGTNNQVAAPPAGQTVSDGHPWATTVVFKADGHNSNQHIWNLGEGAGSTDDNIYLRMAANRYLYFGWGRDGDLADMFVQDIGGSLSGWHAVYIAHNGRRTGSGGTTVDMASCFDVRYTRGNLNWAIGSNLSVSANWTGGCRMNRSYSGDLTLGGRGANRSFHGKIAAFVTTTLRCGQAMPTDAEISEMITDPMGWLQDYKVGNLYRRSDLTSNSTNFLLRNSASVYNEPRATQVFLMGDGTNDSYSNMIRNQVNPADQNETKMNMISMVSNDIENVTISGLSN